MKRGRFGLAYYFVPLASAVCVSVGIGFILTASDARDMGSSLLIGLALGLLVALPLSINNALTPHTPHPYLLGLITGGYHLVSIVGVTAVIAALHA